ncbi:MAG: TrkA family potassium uptake protein, partial [Myxococcales bacterium]|nr:TrkA family potassium uptake protein [Myxococcales bacterium]
LDQHFIVCGCGRTGRYVADELLSSGRSVVVIERDARRFEGLLKDHGERFIGIEGDATDDLVLRDAGIERAKGLVAALQLDQDNLFVALSARQINPKLRIVSRANAEKVGPKLKQAGADAVVSPTNIGGRRMAHELVRPNVVGFLDLMVRDKQQNLDIEEMPIPKESPLVGRTLATSSIREKSSALVLAVLHDGDATYNPAPSFKLDAGMTLVVLGEREQLDRLGRFVRGAE